MSGHANFTYLRPEFYFSYAENSRRIPHPDQYESYWQAKFDRFRGVLHFSEPSFRNFLKDAQAAEIPLAKINCIHSDTTNLTENPVDLADKSQSHKALLNLRGSNGDTQIGFQLSKPLSKEQAESLFQLVHGLDFDILANAWELSQSPTPPPKELARGILMPLFFDQFSLAVSISAYIRHDHFAELQAQLQAYLKELAPRVKMGFEKLRDEKLIWINPDKLISLKEKFGARFEDVLKVNDPFDSLFNPHGPLFDDFGVRSHTRLGLVDIDLLFVSNEKWETDNTWGQHRGAFEEWLHAVVREPIDYDRVLISDLQLAFPRSEDQIDPNSAESKQARERAERLAKIPQLRTVGGAQVIDHLVRIILESSSNFDGRAELALGSLRWMDWPGRREFILNVFKENRISGKFAIVSQMAAESAMPLDKSSNTPKPDRQLIDALIALYQSANVEVSDRDWVKYALQTIRNQAKSAGLTDLVTEIVNVVGS